MTNTPAESSSLRFKFDLQTRAILLGQCKPSPARLKILNNKLGALSGPDAIVIELLEWCADKYLDSDRRKAWPAKIQEQRKYLQDLKRTVHALDRLLYDYPRIEGTTADPFKFLQTAPGLNASYSSTKQRAEFRQALLALESFANLRLKDAVKPWAFELVEEQTKRRSTFPRLVLLSDLLFTYVRITGKKPTAYAHAFGGSEAVEFLLTASRPILRATMDPGTVRKEIRTIERLWKAGYRPELSPAFPDWGKHSAHFLQK